MPNQEQGINQQQLAIMADIIGGLAGKDANRLISMLSQQPSSQSQEQTPTSSTPQPTQPPEQPQPQQPAQQKPKQEVKPSPYSWHKYLNKAKESTAAFTPKQPRSPKVEPPKAPEAMSPMAAASIPKPRSQPYVSPKQELQAPEVAPPRDQHNILDWIKSKVQKYDKPDRGTKLAHWLRTHPVNESVITQFEAAGISSLDELTNVLNRQQLPKNAVNLSLFHDDNSPFAILSEPREVLGTGGIPAVVVGPPYTGYVHQLEIAFPGVHFMSVDEASKELEEAAAVLPKPLPTKSYKNYKIKAEETSIEVPKPKEAAKPKQSVQQQPIVPEPKQPVVQPTKIPQPTTQKEPVAPVKVEPTKVAEAPKVSEQEPREELPKIEVSEQERQQLTNKYVNEFDKTISTLHRDIYSYFTNRNAFAAYLKNKFADIIDNEIPNEYLANDIKNKIFELALSEWDVQNEDKNPSQRIIDPEITQKTREEVISKFNTHLESYNLPEELKSQYKGYIEQSVKTMPAKALHLVNFNTENVVFYENLKDLGFDYIEDKKDWLRSLYENQELSYASYDAALAELEMLEFEIDKRKQEIGGLYNRDTKSISLDGGFKDVEPEWQEKHGSTLSKEQRTVHIYIHEQGHAIDGPNSLYSSKKEWKWAFSTEIVKKGKNPLSNYAATQEDEGFSEFCRLVYSGDISLDVIEEKFPICSQFFQKYGLWPE